MKIVLKESANDSEHDNHKLKIFKSLISNFGNGPDTKKQMWQFPKFYLGY